MKNKFTKYKFTKNLGLKIIALFTSIFLWLIIINVDDPVKVAEFDNIEVTLINTDVITDSNKICEVLDKTNYISVKVYAKRKVLDSLDANNIRAVADLSDLEDTIRVADTSNGMAYLDNVKISLSTNKYNNDVQSIVGSADYVKVSIEDLKRIQKSISVEIKGEPAEGYVIGDITTNSNLVRIAGPASEVNQIATAKVNADVTGFSDTISWDADIRLYDSNGEEVNTTNLTTSLDKIRTTVEILEKKEVPIVASTTGSPKDGYGLAGSVTISPKTVEIAGPSEVIEDVTKITIPSSAIDITGASEDIETSVNITQYLPENVVFVDNSYNGMVNVVASIQAEVTQTVWMSLNELKVLNVPEGYQYKITSPAANLIFTIQGMEDVLSEFDRSSVTASVDFDKIFTNQEESVDETQGAAVKEGSYEMQVDLVLPTGVKIKDSVTATLELTSIESETE